MTSFSLFGIPVLIAQWIGIFLLARSSRPSEWWWMLIGTALNTLAPMLLITGFLFFGLSTPMDFWGLSWLMTEIGSILGPLLFMVGFALHAARQPRLRGRLEELEMMNLAQATELERLRNR